MANTIKFGNGQWATKKSSILAFNDENANFKPLPFTTSRASTATRINKEGLIETVRVDVPRVDYLNNPKGAYLLEPQSTNLIPYSEDIANGNWVKYGGGSGSAPVVTNNYAISPDGSLNASRVVFDNTGATYASDISQLDETVSVSNGDVTNSVWMKSNTASNYTVSFINPTGSRFSTIITTEWQKFELSSVVTNSQSVFKVRLRGGSENTSDYADLLIYGAQTEQQSFATSYIPTSGGTQTRLEDDFTATLPTVSAFNSNNGFTFFGTFESSGGSGASSMMLQFNNNSGYTGFGHNGTNWRTRINNGANNITDITNIPLLTKSSLSIAISPTDYSIFANGAQQTSGLLDLSGSTIVNSIGFRSGAEFGSVRISDLRMYNTKLTDAELTTLTTI